MLFGSPLMPDACPDEAASVPSYRILQAVGPPRRLLKSPPSVLLQNAPRVLALTTSSTASAIVTVNENGVVRRFSFAETEESHIRPSVVRLLMCAAISPDGKVHATVNLMGNILLIDAASGPRQLPSDPSWARTTALQFSADGKRLTTATSAGEIQIWNVANATRLGTRTFGTKTSAPATVLFLAFSPTGDFIAGASMEGEVRIYSLADAASVKTIMADAARNTALVFSADGKHLAIGKSNGTITVVDLASSPKRPHVCGLGAACGSVAQSSSIGQLGRDDQDLECEQI